MFGWNKKEKELKKEFEERRKTLFVLLEKETLTDAELLDMIKVHDSPLYCDCDFMLRKIVPHLLRRKND